jgi:hypothetical protein
MGVIRVGKVTAGLLALGLFGCTQSNSVCQAITDPIALEDPVEMLRLSNTMAWAKSDAEACVHRNGYRLAGAKETADLVARSVVQACESPINKAVSFVRADQYDFAVRVVRETTDEADQSADEAEAKARKSYLELAIMRVVEGRAGNCKS